MSDEPSQRRVMIVEDKRTISHLLYALFVQADCEPEADAGRQALAMMPRASFDVVMVNARCSGVPTLRFPAILALCPQALGRILWLTVDLADGKGMEWMENSCTPQPRLDTTLLHEVWTTFRGLIGIRRLAS